MNRTHLYKGVIFDLDGTLADTLEDIAGSMNQVLVAHHYPVHAVDSYKLLVGRGLDNLVTQALPEDARNKKLISLCLAEMMEVYERNCIVKTHLYPGIDELISTLIESGVRISVFSNKAEPLTIKIVNHLLRKVPFTKILGAGAGFPKKPDPAGALYISRLMNCPPENIVYVGDSDVDMITASKAGMFAMGVSWGFRSRNELLANGAGSIAECPKDLIDFMMK